MTGFFEDGILRFEGLDDKDIADLNAALGPINGAFNLVKPHIPNLIRIGQKIIAKQRELK